MGLIVLVRPTNLVFGLLIPLFGAGQGGSIGLTFLRAQLPRFMLMVAAGLVVFLPQLIVWQIATGHWLTNPYPGEGFNFAAPRFLDVLFRLYYHGFLPWSPIMILALIGIPLMWRKARPMVLPTIVIFLINLWVIASWSTWFYGGGFGHRAFIDEFPLLAFGLASLYAAATPLLSRLLVAVPAFAVCLVTIVMMLHYWEFILSPGGASREQYFRILFHRL